MTDIESSTARWEAYPDAMRKAINLHDRLLTDIIGHHHGYIFGTAGDSFNAAFAAPSSAVAAAYHAQKALSKANFSAVGGLKVRMAVHAGFVNSRKKNYSGSGINQAARLLSIAYGGQVLVSGTVTDLIKGELPDQVSLVDLGRHRFRGLRESEQVFQLVGPGVAAAFPPLRSFGASMHHLPRPISPIVGRDSLIAEVKQRLAKYPLLTLVGSGGAGKTRVAVQVGYDLLETYPDGVWLIELGPIEDPRLVAEQVCATVGVPIPDGRTAVQSAVGFFREKYALIVLDNCEHLITAAAELADALTNECPSVAILATSREPLALAGESVFRVPSLTVPSTSDGLTVDEAMEFSAVELFVERAAAMAENFELSEANVAAVASVCRQVDGVPLAIELAVPRLRVMQPEWLAEGLRDRFRLLGSGSRTALPRHRTMQTLFEWSYNLLSPPEQTLLRRASVFAGGWTADSATAVVSGDTVDQQNIMELVSSLVDKSLVVADLSSRIPRYRLLETTRQYAFDKLRDTGERGRRRRLAEHMLDLYTDSCVSWARTATVDWLERYEPDLDNLRCSLEWAFSPDGNVEVGLRLAGASLRIWDELSLLPERQRWFTTAIDSALETTPAEILAPLWLGRTSFSSHGDQSAFNFAKRAAELYRDIGDPLGLGEALTKAGASLLTPQDIAVAQSYLDQAFEALRPHGPTKQLASCLRSRAVAAYFAGDFHKARDLISSSADTASTVGDTLGIVNAEIALGELEFAEGRVAEAIEVARSMISKRRHNPRQFALGLGNLTSYLLADDRIAEAKLTAFNGLHKARALGWSAAIVRMIEHLALVAALENDLRQAAELLGFTEKFYEAGTASREITEQASFDRAKALVAALPDRVLSEARQRGALLTETKAIEIAMKL